MLLYYNTASFLTGVMAQVLSCCQRGQYFLRASVWVLAVLLWSQLPADAPGEAPEVCPPAWAPDTHMENLHGISGFRFWPGLALMFAST